jgi:hypothetical protein
MTCPTRVAPMHWFTVDGDHEWDADRKRAAKSNVRYTAVFARAANGWNC